MHVAVAQAHIRDAEADGLVHGRGAAPLEQGGGFIVAQNPRRKVKEKFVHKA